MLETAHGKDLCAEVGSRRSFPRMPEVKMSDASTELSMTFFTRARLEAIVTPSSVEGLDNAQSC
ncbi:hypothetical protein [Marinoscillum sp.]|uniref:hypothetical protein n=1 Tax=Marinoscillum sp. TaxID=2024838 RepID=UPI003BA99844